jgi:hypothetical protein
MTMSTLEWLEKKELAAWANFAYGVETVVCGGINTAYNISNYMLGGVFRGLVLDPPSHPEETHQACQRTLDSKIEMNKPTRQKVLDAFEMRTQEFEFQVGNTSYQLQVKIYDSRNNQSKHTCVRVGGKDETLEVSDVRVYPLLKAYVQEGREEGLCILQVSLHGHQTKTQEEESWRSWKPSEAVEVGRVFLAFLKKSQREVHSLICHSMGSLVLEGLDSEDADLPPVLILDRALPSIWKVGCKLYNPIACYSLYGGACISGWAADPEKKLIEFFKKPSQQVTLSNRKVVIIEVREDWYFSGPGAFSEGFIEDLKQAGVPSYRKCFHPNEITYHKRTHHVLPLTELENGHQKDEDSILPLEPYESVASGIIKYLLLPQRL